MDTNEHSTKRTSTFRIPEDLDYLLHHASDAERLEAANDCYHEAMRQTDEVVELINTIQTTDPKLLKAFDDIRELAKDMKTWKFDFK